MVSYEWWSQTKQWGCEMPMNKVIGNNVVRLRSAQGVSQKSLAERARLSRLALGRIERGEALPRRSTLNGLARALHVSVRELVTPARSLQTVRFRAAKRIRERDQILAQISNWLDDYCFLEETLEDQVAFQLDRLVSEKPRDARTVAGEARALLELADQPIHDICGVLEKCGVRVLRFPRATNSFFGLSIAKDDGGPAIVINTWERISVERWIFSAAHELGHLLLHPMAYDSSKHDEPRAEEKEADTFASYFLMPEMSFKKEWADASGHSLYDRVMKVKRIFHVSYKTVLLRLIYDGEAEKSIFGVFQNQHRRRFGHTLKKEDEPQAMTESDFDERRADEPDRLSEADCLDDRLLRLVRTGLERSKITLSRGAEILRLSLAEMRQLASEWAA